jgi:hypothetical protein
MATTEEARKKNLPPYLPYKTMRSFLDSLRQGVPGRIDKSIMRNMSGGTQSAMLQSLRFLRLIDENGTPTEQLRRLARAEGNERASVMRDVLTSAYGFLFNGGIDLSNATWQQLEEEFRRTGISGDTIRKAALFFLGAARDGEIELSRHIAERKAQAPPRARPFRAQQRGRVGGGKTNGAGAAGEERQPPLDEDPVRRTPSWTELLLAKFPAFDPAWAPEIQQKWFDAFDKLMARGDYEDPEPE